ncbi:MAG TPA: amidohydrolase family protein [Candidatus Hydrogenedentes bacterium]|nr:amidohydrolase family protein [Candidatus Hydrogenedentota bacterium]HRK34529.1 amidohydrolase family protein [Candidatus Hydrogenedentota bacterium]
MANKTSVIDVWAQPVWADRFERIPEIARLFEQSGSKDLLKTGMSTADIVAMMDRGNVEKLMLCAWCRPGRWIYTNDDIAGIVREYPDRFVGVATVDLGKPVEAVRELERAVVELGFKALRVVPWLWNRPPNDKLYYPLYVKCIELGVPFCTQVGHTGPLMPSEVGRPVPYLDEVALTFPELTIVAGHIGYPWTEEMIGLAWKHENVYIDTSAWLPRYYPFQLQQYMQTYGKTKVLFGSNFPQLRVDKCAEDARNLGLPEAIEALFLRENAVRVFKV